MYVVCGALFHVSFTAVTYQRLDLCALLFHVWCEVMSTNKRRHPTDSLSSTCGVLRGRQQEPWKTVHSVILSSKNNMGVVKLQ